MAGPYKKRVTYLFKAGPDVWEVIGYSDRTIEFQETRNNGQEDTHMSGSAEKINGKWVVDEWGRKQIEMYGRSSDVADIEAFFNEHGAPGGA